MKRSSLILLILLCGIGCGDSLSKVGLELKEDADALRERVENLEKTDEELIACSQATTLANEAQDAHIDSLRQDLDAHKASTADELGRMRTTYLPRAVWEEMKAELKKREEEEAKRLSGSTQQPPAAVYTPPQAPSYSPPPPAPQIVVPQPVQQQQGRPCYYCQRCRRYHYYP